MLLTNVWQRTVAATAAPAGVRFYSRSLLHVPVPRNGLASAQDFLTAIGRDVEKRVSVEKWEDLFVMRRNDFKKLGVGVQDRRYIMWAMNKYRFGAEPSEFAHPVKPKKKIRGHGPRLQLGKRIR
ncbi:hypothetical protein DL93DRAFT_1100553 [Clavulina sp. PMI_390]|nr:hypothetical protein DL93DRAFT_1100553 [Clavulina sp. PMI_390]